MSFYYTLENIELGKATESAHTVYTGAQYPDESGRLKKIVFKRNKYNNPQFSRFEVAFSSLASRFLRPNLTPKQFLVKNKKKEIVGLASEFVSYTAARREAAEKSEFLGKFASVDSNTKPRCSTPLNLDRTETGEKSNKSNQTPTEIPKYTFTSMNIKEAENIPIYFLDQFPPGFFNVLWRARKNREIDFDMASLASVLTSSYTLEEDDLHKGNFGFYLVKKLVDGKERLTVVFFKIDNDLMMADSVMSRCSSRIVNWRHCDHAFEVTARDLIHFPKLFDSQNHYWPTSLRYLANPIDAKVYSSWEEIQAFVELGEDKEFQQAKWREFYKHILIPQSIIEKSLETAFDKKNAEDRAQIALIAHAAIARQARLRAVLFTIPQFRDFVQTFELKDVEAMKAEIVDGIEESEHAALLDEVSTNLQHYETLCENGFADGDTPLHVAIRLGDFHYHETLQSFSKFAKQANAKGEKPLDLAVQMIEQQEINSHDHLRKDPDVRKDPYFIAKSLLNEGIDRTDSYRKLSKQTRDRIRNYKFSTIHISNAASANDAQKLLQVMQEIGEDHRFSLKMKKEIAVVCMKKFIKKQRNHSGYEEKLLAMKEALNGGYAKAPAPELQFIRQLRSRLWIVRKIRGLLGGTSTQVDLNRLINDELTRLNPGCFSCFSFFYNKNNYQLKYNSIEKQMVVPRCNSQVQDHGNNSDEHHIAISSIA